MTAYVSRDRHWRVRPIVLNGRQLLRVEHDSAQGFPIVTTGRRVGPTRGAGGWFHAADVRSIAEVERFVPLTELEEEPAK
jgi:hypothetical protein